MSEAVRLNGGSSPKALVCEMASRPWKIPPPIRYTSLSWKMAGDHAIPPRGSHPFGWLCTSAGPGIPLESGVTIPFRVLHVVGSTKPDGSMAALEHPFALYSPG